jgi:hypothetical protein
LNLNLITAGRVAQLLILQAQPTKWGAPFFAFFAKGGHDAANSAYFNSTKSHGASGTDTRPFAANAKERGTPNFLLVRVRSNLGHPPYPSVTRPIAGFRGSLFRDDPVKNAEAVASSSGAAISSPG